MSVGNILTMFRVKEMLVVIFQSHHGAGEKRAYLFGEPAASAIENGADPAYYSGIRIPVPSGR